MAVTRGVRKGVVVNYLNLISFIFVVCQTHVTLSDVPSTPCEEGNEGEYVRDTDSCSVAYVCDYEVTSTSWQWLEISCPEGFWFDLNINSCNQKFMVQCSKEINSTRVMKRPSESYCQKYQKIINEILESNSTSKKSPHQYYLLKKYEVLECGDVRKLIRKREQAEEDPVYFVSIEDTYESFPTLKNQLQNSSEGCFNCNIYTTWCGYQVNIRECSRNQCLLNGVCTVIPGGYRCSYPNHINGDEDEEFSLLVSQYGTREIFSFDIEDGSFTYFCDKNNGQPNVMEYDRDTGKVYIAFENQNAIKVTDLEKSSFKTLRRDVTSEGLLVDSGVDRLFYSDYTKRTINSMTTTGADHKTLVSELGRPRSIVADKSKQVLYWIDITKERIESLNYDGTNRQVFLKTNNIPLALDMAIGSNYLYWCDKRGEIWEVSLEGAPRLVYRPTRGTKECDSLAAIRNQIYIAYMLSTHYMCDMNNVGTVLSGYLWWKEIQDDIDVINLTNNEVEQYSGQGKLKYGKYKTVEIVTERSGTNEK